MSAKSESYEGSPMDGKPDSKVARQANLQRERATSKERSAGHRRAVSRGEGWPTWMWAPEAEPGMAPHAAMNGIPAARR